jgi:hypothetical protein
MQQTKAVRVNDKRVWECVLLGVCSVLAVDDNDEDKTRRREWMNE